MQLTAVCISTKEEHWELDIPFFCLSEPGPSWGRVKDPKRIDYLADKQNRALEKALTHFPETTHILWIDSYYLGQTDAIHKLVNDFEPLSRAQGNLILGGAILCHNRTKVRYRISYYDTWSTPELDGKYFQVDLSDLHEGFEKVSSVGGVYICPRAVWELHRYQRPEPFPESGCQHNYLCRESGLPIFLDWNALFWRNVSYSTLKRLRCSIGDYRRRMAQVLKPGETTDPKVQSRGYLTDPPVGH